MLGVQTTVAGVVYIFTGDVLSAGVGFSGALPIAAGVGMIMNRSLNPDQKFIPKPFRRK